MLSFKEWGKFKIIRPLFLIIGTLLGKWSIVGDKPIYQKDEFEWTGILEKRWLDIREELDQLLRIHNQLPNLQDIQKEQQVINTDNKWKTFFLYGFGNRADLNCELCPVTASVVENIPGMVTAFFSFLSPRKRIPPHRGIYKGLIRSHLGLIIPGRTGECRMRIANEVVNWEEGKIVVFDDTYEHEVWNDTDQIRVVLLIDTIRPFRFPLSQINQLFIKIIANSSFVKRALQNNQKWEERQYRRSYKSSSSLKVQ